MTTSDGMPLNFVAKMKYFEKEIAEQKGPKPKAGECLLQSTGSHFSLVAVKSLTTGAVAVAGGDRHGWVGFVSSKIYIKSGSVGDHGVL